MVQENGMASTTSSSSKPKADLNALKVAVAIALVRSKHLRQQSLLPSSVSESDAQRWKRKSKERKRELILLREELKQLEERGRGSQPDVFPQFMSCRCHFFDGRGTLSSGGLPSGGERRGDGGGSCEHWIDDVLRRRFLRHVRWKERQKRLGGSIRKRHYIDVNDDNEVERLGSSVDFLVELSGSIFPDKNDSVFAASSHQAVDSILVSLKKLLLLKRDAEIIEEMVNSLITRLFQRMCTSSGKDGSSSPGLKTQHYVQHLIRRLGNEAFIGQRAILFVSQRISSLADSLTVTDPFDDAFPDMHDCMFLMIQLTEFMISDNLHNWATNGNMDSTSSFFLWVIIAASLPSRRYLLQRVLFEGEDRCILGENYCGPVHLRGDEFLSKDSAIGVPRSAKTFSLNYFYFSQYSNTTPIPLYIGM